MASIPEAAFDRNAAIDVAAASVRAGRTASIPTV